jgi:hypothetical protein
MLRVLLTILLLPAVIHGQQKENILKAVIDINRLETADLGPIRIDPNKLSEDLKKAWFEVPNKHNNYLNFSTLVKLITIDELDQLTHHPNGVVRMFAFRELLKSRSEQFNYFDFFIQEYGKNDTIKSKFADMIDESVTWKIFLADISEDWNVAQSNSNDKGKRYLRTITKRIDSFILYANPYFPDWVYETVFDRRIFSKSSTTRIRELAVDKLNFSAFEYLKIHNKAVFAIVREHVLSSVVKSKEHFYMFRVDAFQRFLRYMVRNRYFKMAKQMISVFKNDNYYEVILEQMLGGIDKMLVRKIK